MRDEVFSEQSSDKSCRNTRFIFEKRSNDYGGIRSEQLSIENWEGILCRKAHVDDDMQ